MFNCCKRYRPSHLIHGLKVHLVQQWQAFISVALLFGYDWLLYVATALNERLSCVEISWVLQQVLA